MRQSLIKQSLFARLLRYVDKYNPPTYRKRKVSNAQVLYEVVRVLKTGTCWRDTANYSSWQAIYKRFRVWTANKTFFRMWKSTVKRYARAALNQDDATFSAIFVDATFVKNIGGTDCTGRNPTDRGRLATKVSIVCDRRQTVLGMVAERGNIADCHLMLPTLESIPCVLARDGRRVVHVVGDKAYSSPKQSNILSEKFPKMRLIASKKRGMRPPNSKCVTAAGEDMLRKRHVVENAFCSLKMFKRIRTRYDRCIDNYLPFWYFGMTYRMLARDEALGCLPE
jgi:transposase